ncbi:hypothetical protein T459_26261 [Capsicum annuum]|uniref:HECT-type E3 ubiquitin transferase n=1 Tax=Capsicum annuum TaxID=4072 RepID=A0A2G2YN30_CAPAN|nr:hypothetical protein T459_26261 [Capsicum annuum]
MQLCEMLSIVTEDSLSIFFVYSFVPVLLGLLNHMNNPDIIFLVARALTHVVDILSSSCVAILHYRAVSCFVARLLTIEYMDLAEQDLKKISQVHPSAYLRAGTLMAVLSYIDFFSARVQRVALATAAHMCKKLPSDASNLVLPMYFFRLRNERILGSSLNPLNPLKSFTSSVPALLRRMPENVNPRLRTSCCPRCKEKYNLELAKLVSEFEISSSEAKLESPRPQLPQWLQNDMLKNDSNVTSLSQIKDQGKFELDNLQRDSNEIANELGKLKEEMLVDLSLEDVKCVALHYGFVFEKESTIETTYTTNSRSMIQERTVDVSSITTVCSPLRGQNDPLLCQSIRGLHYVVDNMLIELLLYQLVSKMKKQMKKMMKTLTVLEKIFGLWINALISIVLC